MYIQIDTPEDVQEIMRYNEGEFPVYGKKSSISRGIVWCICGQCVGNILYHHGGVTGWFKSKCICGRKINWSQASKML